MDSSQAVHGEYTQKQNKRRLERGDGKCAVSESEDESIVEDGNGSISGQYMDLAELTNDFFLATRSGRAVSIRQEHGRECVVSI